MDYGLAYIHNQGQIQSIKDKKKVLVLTSITSVSKSHQSFLGQLACF